jgi:hypothetical protein
MLEWFRIHRSKPSGTLRAKLIWSWAARFAPEPRNTQIGPKIQVNSTGVDLCRDLANRSLETRQLPESDVDFDLTVALAEASGELRELKKESGRLWLEAIHPWHQRLLLSLFPSQSFEPSARQLGKLVYYRQWLKGHLDNCPPHGNRRKNFNVATKGFHEVEYPRSDGVQWNDAYINNSTIWAAFKGVPAQLEVNLLKALQAYDPTREQHMSMCRNYLMGYDSTTKGYYYALERVLDRVLLPALSWSGRDRQSVEKLFTRIRKDELSDTGSFLSLRRREKIWMPDRAMQALIVEIVINGDRDFVFDIIRDFFEKKKR